MLRKILLAAHILLPALASASASTSTAVEDEHLYRETQKALLEDPFFRIHPDLMSHRRLKIALDVIEDTLSTGKSLPLTKILLPAENPRLPPKELARWFRLRGTTDEDFLVNRLSHAPASSGLLYELFRLRTLLKTDSARTFVEAKSRAQAEDTRIYNALTGRAYVPPTSQEVHDLFFELPDLAHFQNGAFAGHPRLFVFCHHQRNYACLAAIKDKDDKPVRVNGNLWLLPILAFSGHGLQFNERNGNTPSGVQLINSVVPTAELPYSYGVYRRMILEFVPPSIGEAEQKKLLPKASENSIWWHEAPVARDIGRDSLRIHGTGQKNMDPTVTFYPFISTAGCVTTRELKYGNSTYIDQRQLLDQLMRASGLEAKYENEPALKALLYVVDIDEGSNSAVTADDLAKFGIK